MAVYVDVLLLINLLVDYFLLSLTARLLKKKTSVLRLVLSSLLGALSSLYIFLPQMNIVFEVLIKVAVCGLMTLIGFNSTSLKGFLRSLSVLVAVTFGYAGFMIAFWYTFKPSGMIINNSVVYFNVSPLFLIAFSVVAYLIISIVKKVTEKNCDFAKVCEIEVFAEGKSAALKAIIDTGNSVEDMFSLSEVIVVDESVLYELFDDYPTSKNLDNRYRALPLSTVSGAGLLNGYRCDTANVIYNGKKIQLIKPILAISKAKLNDGYNSIINPKILE